MPDAQEPFRDDPQRMFQQKIVVLGDGSVQAVLDGEDRNIHDAGRESFNDIG